MIPLIDREPDFELVGYLHRWYLKPRDKKGNIYLHHIIQPDVPVLHDHPWDFQSTILHGGYDEVFHNNIFMHGKMYHGQGTAFVRSMTDQHYISDVQPDTWSLVLTGPVERNWGFWIDGEFIPHEDYRTHRGIEAIHRVPETY